MQYDIFISYSRRNLQEVKKIKDVIEKSTLATCWIDLEGIESGTPKFTKAIINAINACPIFLFMLSEESQKSENALKELDFAYKKYREEGKKVVIVDIEKCKMTEEFSFDYGKADMIDWQDKEQREKLIRDLRDWIEKSRQIPHESKKYTKSKEYDIFISYRRVGGAQYARILQLMLQQRGYNVFLDYDELGDGQFNDHITAAIKEAPIFMLVLSDRALDRCRNEDDWVRQEIMLAEELNKQIIPVNPDNSFNGIPEGVPDAIRYTVDCHQHSEINFGQTLGVTLDFMVENRIAPIVGERAQESHIDSDFDAAKQSLVRMDERNRLFKRVRIIAGIILLIGIVALAIILKTKLW